MPSVRRVHDVYGHDKRYPLLHVDFRNAFNLVSRPAFLRIVKENFPSLLQSIQYSSHDRASSSVDRGGPPEQHHWVAARRPS